jgi:BirA family biotin operon repressor/biotin-[acetyl-CoA-carboxylase] ligase
VADELIRLLSGAGGRFVSGEEASRLLGISRAAVWKRVTRLRAAGYAVEGLRGEGYRLASLPDAVEEGAVRPLLRRPGAWPVLDCRRVVDSTNAVAADLAAAGCPHGTVVAADAQEAGRGRLGRSWSSPPGVNLYVSVVLRPPVEPYEAPRLTLVAAVALARAVEEVASLPARLKWPNDLYVNGRKAAGILAEMSADMDRLRHVVIGTGVNVNGLRASFPPDLREKGTTLREEAGRPFPRASLLAAFLDRLADAYDTFLDGGFAALLPEWEGRSLLSGKAVTLRLRGTEARGVVTGTGEDGALLFLAEGAKGVEAVHSGEIVRFDR